MSEGDEEGRDLIPQSASAASSGDLAIQSAPRLAARQAVEEAAGELAKRSASENTTRSYRSDWQSWEAFCCFHGFTPLPADPEQVRLYLTQLTQFAGRSGGKVKPRTAQRHLVAIAAAHRAQDIGFDTQHPVLRRTMDGIRRTFGARQEGAPALRHGDIAAICKTFRADVRSVRDKAIILLGFAGGFRRSELVALNVEDLDFDKGGLTILLKRSKTDQEGKGRTVGIVKGADPLTCPVAAVQAWLRAASIKEAGNSALFYPVNRRGGVELNRLSDRAVDRIVKYACRAARLKDKGYSAHSLRAGHVTEALASGADRTAVKRQTGHASDAMLDRYAREADLFKNNSSGNLGL
jgi:site-specific recombinase XerD